MKIKINGEVQELDAVKTLKDLVERKGLEVSKIVIEHNYNIVPRETIADVSLNENDIVEIVSFVGGG